MYVEKNIPLIFDSTHAASKSSGSMMVRFEPQVDIPPESMNVEIGLVHATVYNSFVNLTGTNDHTRAKGPVPFSTSGIQDIQIRLGGTTYPTVPYAALNSVTNNDIGRAYADSCNSRCRLSLDSSMPKSLEAFARQPVLNFNIYRAAGDVDTQIHLRATLGAAYAAGRLIVVCYANELLAMTYKENELVRVETQAVV